MNFVATYRDRSGKLLQTGVAAPDRAACFKELKRRGIAPIKVEEGDAPPVVQPVSTGGSRPRRSVVVAGLGAALVALIVAALVFWPSGGDDPQSALKSPHKSAPMEGLAREKQPIVASETNQAPAAASSAAEAKPVAHAAAPETTAPEPQVTNAPPSNVKKGYRIVERKAKKRLFHTMADVQISRILNTKPGQAVIGTMNYSLFAEQLKRALEKPIEIDENDTPEDIALKNAVRETREDLKRRMDAGEDIGQVMHEAETELRRMWNYRQNLHKELAATMRERKMSANDFRNYVDAANKMLQDRGIEPLKHPEFWCRRLQIEEAASKSK